MASRTPYICFNCRFSRELKLPTRRLFTTSSPRREVVRPATAPKQTPDIKDIRQNADLYTRNCLDRNYPSQAEYPYKIQQLSDEARRLDQDLKTPRSRIKHLEQTIAKLSPQNAQHPLPDGETSSNEELAHLRSEAQRLKDESQAMSSRRTVCTDEVHRLALSLPNLSSTQTPVGHDPKLVSYINFDPQSPPEWVTRPQPGRSHVEIGTSLGLLDFASSATTTGWGWYFLTNEGALLEQALIQFSLSVARRHGWKPVSPPSIVYSYIAEACGFQPRDQHNEQQIWTIEQSEKDKSKPQRSLTGTAEIPLAAMYAGRDILASELPIKLVGSSRCYRAEAGSRGVDTKGLYRVHEFTKVELFGWSDYSDSHSPQSTTSNDLFTSLLSIQTEILSSLNLPCRILEMPSTDLGASATRKQDIEVLFPSRLRPASSSPEGAPSAPDLSTSPAWGEVTSASICTDYQSRRLGTRVRGGASKESRFPHTVNGTAMAVPRVLAALLETGFDPASGSVVVPEVLRGFMGGLEVIGAGGK